MILHLTLGTLGLAFISDRLSMHRISEGSPCVFRRQFSSIITSCYVVMVRIDEFFVIFEEEIFHRLLSGILQKCILPYNVVLSPRSFNLTAVLLNRSQLKIGDSSYSIASFHQNIYFACSFISVTAVGCGPVIPVITFVLTGDIHRSVYASGHYGDSVRDGYRILFMLG